MKTLFLIFSHKLTIEQQKEAKNGLKIEKIVYLPENLQKIWSNIEAKDELKTEKLKEITKWLEKTAQKEDYILIQGEFGATFFLVDFCFQSNLIPIYATSKRIYEEKINDDGTVERKHIFKHVNFRRYRKYQNDLNKGGRFGK